MKKLQIYKTGERYLMDGMTISLHGGQVQQEYDLSEATDDEIKHVKKNMHDDNLLQRIHNRKKVVK